MIVLLAPGQDEIAGHAVEFERHDDGGQDGGAHHQDQQQDDRA